MTKNAARKCAKAPRKQRGVIRIRTFTRAARSSYNGTDRTIRSASPCAMAPTRSCEDFTFREYHSMSYVVKHLQSAV